MPRDETKDLMEQIAQMKVMNDAKEDDFLFHMDLTEEESSTFEAENAYNESTVAEEENPFPEKNQNENIPFVKNRQILTSNDIKDNAVPIPMFPNEKTSNSPPLPWNERESLKIRYTRQYLLDRRHDPLSTAFPDCLLKFLQSREIPLKETENHYDCRSMDHILFYSSLPYSRMRNSLTTGTKRTPFKLCY
ncbi:hypothetical protein AVEN_174849-1 [Araneus ventricosus]|uniref:Uncharacterized protein n=1 Tax=Araneus ventricosus TaxID=182803 RepID=A0A4Y2N1D1_ARAVE|nr:hypothetical protein AVEN_174849-1 [Araneus ventricosus]